MVVLDGQVLLHKGVVKPLDRRPAMVDSRELKISTGTHIVTFWDKTRGICEHRLFKGDEIKTLLVRTRQDALEKRHIVASKEKLPIK